MSSTSPSVIECVLEDLNAILLCTTNPGFGGQVFIYTLLPKIKKAREMVEKRGFKIDIEVNGGINQATAPLVVKAEANILVAGTAAYGQKM